MVWQRFFMAHLSSERTWEEELNEISECEKITKDEVVIFVQNFFKDNYVAIKKKRSKIKISSE